MNLSGKRVLFIGPQFFGYETEIISELSLRGAEVDFLPDRPFRAPVMKALVRFRRELLLPWMDRFFLSSLNQLGRQHYDIIFVVQGEGLSPHALKAIRSLYPQARIVWYLWDSLRNKKSLRKNLALFDACHTFDQEDSKAYGMQFRPLFFAPNFAEQRAHELEYDLSFIGTAHSDRFRIVSEISSQLSPQAKYYFYLYLQAPWVYRTHKIFNSSFRQASLSDFRFTPLAKSTVQDVFLKSKTILDIEHPRQTGLTMRTFETLGSRKKLITTNASVRDYDFYHPDNILVIDRKRNPTVSSAFLASPYAPLSEKIYEKYSRAGWLTAILA